MAVSHTPGRFITSNTSLKFLILWGYNLDDDRLAGAPKWLDSAKYDIVAKIPDEQPSPGRLNLMMRSLLAERFKLLVHTEFRDLPSYTLLTEKGGPKFGVASPVDAIGQNPFHMSDPGSLTGSKVTAEMLAKVLSGQLGRPVQDATGIEGVFDFTLKWSPDMASQLTDDPNRPSLFAAIREQLGLRIEFRRSRVEVIVIDHVEPGPADN